MTGFERARECTRAVRRLAVNGWGLQELAEELGWNRDTLGYMRRQGRSYASISSYLQLIRLYEELRGVENKSPNASRTRAHAIRQGWHLEAEPHTLR